MSITDKYKNLLQVDDRGSQGEVSTPAALVNEMLDKLPEEVFKSDTTTFLDPSFGSGTFLIEIVKRLRKEGHSIENIQERIYGTEISHRLYNKVTKLFSKYNFHKLYKEDFLTKDFNNMKFDVVIGNPPFNDASTVQSTGRRRTGRMYLDFMYKAVELSNRYVLMISPARGWIVGTRRGKYLAEFLELGLQELVNCDDYFDIKLLDVIYAFIDKNTVVDSLNYDDTKSKYSQADNNLGKFYVRSTSEKRGVLETIEDEGGSLVYLTTSKTTTIKDTSIVQDKDSHRWRVIFNVNGGKDSIGKVLIAKPGELVSYSVCYLLAEDENDAIRIKGIISSDKTSEIMKHVRVSASNTKYHFSFIENI